MCEKSIHLSIYSYRNLAGYLCRPCKSVCFGFCHKLETGKYVYLKQPVSLLCQTDKCLTFQDIALKILSVYDCSDYN